LALPSSATNLLESTHGPPNRPEAIEKGTGRAFAEWISIFDAVESDRPTHQELAATAITAGAPPWWCQIVSVAYEQHVGLRFPGQDVTGEFSVAVSSTRDGSLDAVFAQWLGLVGERTSFSEIKITKGPERSSSKKWRYWRCSLADGSRVVVNIGEKPPAKAVISIQHEKLACKALAESWQAYWRTFLRDL
jgi:hypothetical protein